MTYRFIACHKPPVNFAYRRAQLIMALHGATLNIGKNVAPEWPESVPAKVEDRSGEGESNRCSNMDSQDPISW